MRISTSQIYDAGALNIQRNQSSLYKLQNQLSTGRRVLTPADDPVAAAQALVVTQSIEVNAQHVDNQGSARSQLGLVDSQLGALTSLLQNVRDRVIQAGNVATMSNADRQGIATEQESRLAEMVGIANSQNGAGDYLFSGYQGATLPFAIDTALAAVAPATTSPFGYFGDDGERLVQVSSSRQMAVSVAGSDVFMSAREGNGTFVTTTGANNGSATFDAGSVLDQQKWALAVNNAAAGSPLEIRFASVGGVMSYGIYDPVGGLTTPLQPYTSGQVIPLTTAGGVDFGAQLVVQGQPSDGDKLIIEPSASQSLFQTMQSLIGILKAPVGTQSYTATEYSNALNGQLANIDQALENVSRVQAKVGTRLAELDSLSETSADLDVQYKSTLSDLQDLDYAKAISEFTMQQTFLEAAQKSFAQVSGLSLFNYL